MPIFLEVFWWPVARTQLPPFFGEVFLMSAARRQLLPMFSDFVIEFKYIIFFAEATR